MINNKFKKIFKHPYVALLFVLCLLILWLFSYSYSNSYLSFWGFELRKSEMAAFTKTIEEEIKDSVKKKTPQDVSSNVAHVEMTPPIVEENSKEPDTTSQHFLLIGDSMLEGLRRRLFDYCKENNHSMNAVIWYSSSTLWYGNSDTLKHFVKKYNPSYVLISLGTNEQFVKDLDRRDKCIKNITSQIGDIPYIWIGPPSWKKDTGINELIRKNVGEGNYFDSSKLTLARAKDGAHPTKMAAMQWMDSLAVFMNQEAKHRLKMKFPQMVQKTFPNTILLQPNSPPGLK
ncbi:MAG: hypothetical protein SNJ77_02645 [Cytophagales bacterium]